MASRDKDQAPPHHHQPLLSSLVVRPSHTEGGGGGGAAAAGRAADYDPVELRRDPAPPYSRSDRYPDDPALKLMLPARSWALGRHVAVNSALDNDLGYRIRAGSASPVRRRDVDPRFSSDYNHLSRSRGFGGGRDPGRYRDPSPPYGRGRVGGRPIGRAFDGPGFARGLARGEGSGRNNPNVQPREGDWICPDPVCGNLNFARRDYCNNCNRPRHAPAGSPRRAYPGPPPLHAPPRRFPGPLIDRSPERTMNGYRSTPRGLARDGPREYGSTALPPLRHEGRFPDPHVRRDRTDYMEDAYRGRSKFDRTPPVDWDNRDRGRDGFNDRRGFDRRPLSPPVPLLSSLPPLRGDRWARDVRERSRSPIRGGPPPKDYRRDMLINRSRDDRRGVGRERIGGMY